MRSAAEFREHLGRISSAMARIHRLLIESEIEVLEKKQGAVIGAGARLQLLLNSPDLAWLRVMSQTMAAIDEIYFQKEAVTSEQAAAAKKAADDLLIHGSQTEFFERYRLLMGRIPDLMMEHGHLRLAIRQMNELLKSELN